MIRRFSVGDIVYVDAGSLCGHRARVIAEDGVNNAGQPCCIIQSLNGGEEKRYREGFLIMFKKAKREVKKFGITNFWEKYCKI